MLYFQDLGHSYSPYGPPSRQITYIYLSVCVEEILFFETGEIVLFCQYRHIKSRYLQHPKI